MKLELHPRCPKIVNGITIDPQPDFTFHDLVSELNAIESKINASAPIFVKAPPREFPNKFGTSTSSKAFVMRLSDDDDVDDDDVDNDDEENQDPNPVAGTRFGCTDLYVSDSDSSQDELAIEEIQVDLMEPMGLLEGLLSEKEVEHKKWVQENIRHQISLLEMDLMNENERSTSALIQLEKLAESRQEMDRKTDTQYRRKIAEGLDNHLTAVQRNHEHKSQLEERKIRSEAEEAKRKERALQEERARQEKAKADAEAAERRAEEAKREALEAERRIAKEAAEKQSSEPKNVVLGEKGQEATGSNTVDSAEVSKEIKQTGTTIRAAEGALKAEAERLQKYNELNEKNESLTLSSNKDFRQYEVQIGRHIRQIAGTRENVRTKASELIKVINNPLCPQSVSIAMFAKKIVSQCATLSANIDSTIFACANVIVLVTSQVPLAMDLLLAELHRASIYTVPKHVVKLESGLNEEKYLHALGYREEDGKIESMEQYLGRVESYLKLYGAIVQTEINGVQNYHGIEQGWAWLARLLNALPANIYTTVALEAFLKMAGFRLFRKYKSQFRKILNVISDNFVTALEARGDPKINPVLMKLKTYLDSNQYLREPEGLQMQTSLLSGEIGVPEVASGYYGNQYSHQSNWW